MSLHVVLRPILKTLSILAAIITARALVFIPPKTAKNIFSRNGYHLLRKHYYLPIPDEEDLRDKYWDKQSDLPGLTMNDKGALNLLHNIFPRYMDEFRSRFSLEATNTTQFFLINGRYMAIDAHIYYAMIRHFKPKRIIEIGAGISTVLAGEACMENKLENGQGVDLIAIDPYPDEILNSNFPGLTQLIKTKVQDVDLDLFTLLNENDILFIDSSHVLREGNDVQLEYLEILPRLKPGVLVHIHDISLPKAYPRVYFENQLYWNEQYLLQAFLAFNSRFKVIWAGNYMILNYPEQVCSVFPEYHIMRQHYPMSEPSAFWMRS